MGNKIISKSKADSLVKRWLEDDKSLIVAERLFVIEKIIRVSLKELKASLDEYNTQSNLGERIISQLIQ